MKIRVKMFAIAKQLAKADELELELYDQTSVADLRRAITESVPELFRMMAHITIAVNHEYVNDDYQVKASDEIACIPPVSGG